MMCKSVIQSGLTPNLWNNIILRKEPQFVAAVQTHFAQISPTLPHSWGDEETPFTTIYIYVSFENRLFGEPMVDPWFLSRIMWKRMIVIA